MSDRRREVWLITGTSSGFGRALAEVALKHGHRVVATARKVSALHGLLEIEPGHIDLLPLDLSDRDSISAAVEATIDARGRIDVLVNNAGYGLLGAVEDLFNEDLRQSYETNLFGPMQLARAVLPGMREQGSGRIVQMSSMITVTSGLGGSAYAGPKAALEAASVALAAEVKPFGIRVTIVEPGAFRTDFSGRSLRAAAPSDSYAEIIGPRLRAFRATHGTQPGDPRLGAKAIIDAVTRKDPPLRLPLGPDACKAIAAYHQARLSDLDLVCPFVTDTNFR
jgi:NAD(P)-dependent dehydrogenase (short-subunit alcohol dehydrogenase family)